MKTVDLLTSLESVDDCYVISAWEFRQGQRKAQIKRLPVRKAWLVAAVIALTILLASCGIAAVIFGDSIQEWFGFYWGEITGQDMGADQIAIINKLSQEIGVSDTDGGVTITVDSAAGSEGMFYLLIRVEGYSFNKQYQYSFDAKRLDIDPEMLPDTCKVTSYGIRYLGVDQNGAGLFLMDLCYDLSDTGGNDLGSLPMRLTLKNLIRRINQKEKTVREGQWTFTFSLDRSQIPEKIALPDTLVSGFNEKTGQSIPVLLTNIVLSNTDLRYTFDSPQGSIAVYSNISVLLKNGSCIKDGQGTGILSEDLLTSNYVWHWSIPLNMDDIASITIAGTEITLSVENTRIHPEPGQQNVTVPTDQTDGEVQATMPVRNVLTGYYPRQLPEGYSVRDDSLIDQSIRSILYRNEAEDTIRFSISSQNIFTDTVLAPPVEEKSLTVSGQAATLQISGMGGQVLLWNNDTDGYYAALFTTDMQVDLTAIAESVTPETQ